MPQLFFSNIVKNFEIRKYEVEDDLHLNMISQPTLKAVFKYKNHPRIISIRRFRHQVSNFIFSSIDKNTVLKEITGLSTTKASQETDLPVKILKENEDYFVEFICIQFNDSVHSSKFYLLLNVPTSLLFSKMNTETIKQTTDLSATYL